MATWSRIWSRNKYLILFFLIFTPLCIYFIQDALTPVPRLPIYEPQEMNPELVDDSMRFVKKNHTIADFKMINQNGDTITQQDYAGHIYVADFFFTTCPSICPIMTDNLVQVQKAYPDEVKLLSFSVTPDYDTPAILRTYADKKGVNDAQWNLVTGEKKAIYDLARKSFFAVKDNPTPGSEYGMIHTENFTLIDPNGRIRGSYDGTSDEEVTQLIEDIAILQLEFPES